ncbi:Cyclin-dependent kinase inhibitor 1C [Triplophysa tibetana]|uniref:Cyclin-dependent kinase inhibitor 1C n=1 Tax=Triplophysa tibetana TaxID=1572043 RepID=A0A5A9PUB2_9TELE|nr:Cyclin-dependent kinase inhibitor 1C [Triplophysa tibetana]
MCLHTNLGSFLIWISTKSPMSTVLLSSIAMDRLNARETVSGQKSGDISPQVLPVVKRKGTCRNLFGPVDHDELQRELTSKLKDISDRDRLRWNFDFSEGRPLDGELEWEESPAGECPTFYRERITTAVSKEPKREILAKVPAHCGGRPTSVNMLNRENEADKRNVNPRKSRKTAAHARTKRLTDLRITDFYTKRRRTGTVTPKESRSVE